MTIPAAVLDSDVIFSRVLHELMGRLALARFYRLIWSDETAPLAGSSPVRAPEYPVGAGRRGVEVHLLAEEIGS